MAFTSQDFVASIESRLGQGGKHVWEYYRLASGTPWCAAEISFTFDKIGGKKKWYGGSPVFYVPYAQVWMEQHWDCVYDYRKGGSLKNVRKGDVIIFMWAKGHRDHIGVAREDSKSESQILTIEGNTSGSKVAERTRAKANVFAVYRPPWSDAEQNAPKAEQNAGKTEQKESKTSQDKKKTSAPKYTVGKVYTVAVDCLNVRSGAGTKYQAKTKKQLTADGKKNSNSFGQLMKGTKVTCRKTKNDGSKVWMEIPSGWICAWNGSKQYVK